MDVCNNMRAQTEHRSRGRPRIYSEPLTGAERVARYREKLKQRHKRLEEQQVIYYFYENKGGLKIIHCTICGRLWYTFRKVKTPICDTCKAKLKDDKILRRLIKREKVKGQYINPEYLYFITPRNMHKGDQELPKDPEQKYKPRPCEPANENGNTFQIKDYENS